MQDWSPKLMDPVGGPRSCALANPRQVRGCLGPSVVAQSKLADSDLNAISAKQMLHRKGPGYRVN